MTQNITYMYQKREQTPLSYHIASAIESRSQRFGPTRFSIRHIEFTAINALEKRIGQGDFGFFFDIGNERREEVCTLLEKYPSIPLVSATEHDGQLELRSGNRSYQHETVQDSADFARQIYDREFDFFQRMKEYREEVMQLTTALDEMGSIARRILPQIEELKKIKSMENLNN